MDKKDLELIEISKKELIDNDFFKVIRYDGDFFKVIRYDNQQDDIISQYSEVTEDGIEYHHKDKSTNKYRLLVKKDINSLAFKLHSFSFSHYLSKKDLKAIKVSVFNNQGEKIKAIKKDIKDLDDLLIEFDLDNNPLKMDNEYFFIIDVYINLLKEYVFGAFNYEMAMFYPEDDK